MVAAADLMSLVLGTRTFTVAVARSQFVAGGSHWFAQIVFGGGLLGSGQNVTSFATPKTVNVPWAIATLVVSWDMLLTVQVNVQASSASRAPSLSVSPLA